MGCLHPGRASFVAEKSVRLDLAGSAGTVLAGREYHEEEPAVIEIEAQGPRISFRERGGDGRGPSSSGEDDDDEDDSFGDSGDESDSSVELFPGDMTMHLPRDRRPSQEDNEGLDLIYRGLDAELRGLSALDETVSPTQSGGGDDRSSSSSSSSSNNNNQNENETVGNFGPLSAGLSMIEQSMREEFGSSWSKGHRSREGI